MEPAIYTYGPVGRCFYTSCSACFVASFDQSVAECQRMTTAMCRTAAIVVKCPDLSFHGFPVNEDLRKRWLVAIRPDVGQHFEITSSTVVCGTHFTAAYFSTGSRQGSGGIKLKTHRLNCEAVPSVFAWRATVKTRPTLWERSLSGVAAKVRVATCATEVKLERARKDLEWAREETAYLRTQVLQFKNLHGGS